jgi:cytochrome oxidase assembly protein ShyY1
MAAPVQVGISTGGKLFFGGLTAGTFGLGCWQLHRLQNKLAMIEDRQNQLVMEPSSELSASSDDSPYRRRLLEGTFRHDKEVLVGPRGAPSGVSLPRTGLSANSSSNASVGMAPGPQGFHVLTPLELGKEWQGTRKVVWVNRGWIPKTFIPGSDGKTKDTTEWDRPKGPVKVTTIRSSPESTYIGYVFGVVVCWQSKWICKLLSWLIYLFSCSSFDFPMS